MKPGVTFFGEILGDKVRRTLEADRDKADAMIVIGTSLSVAPMSKIIDFLPRKIPRILINRTVVHPPRCALDDDEDDDDEDDVEFRENYIFDAYMLGFCDDVTRALVKEMKDKTNHESSDTNDKQKKKKNSKNNNGTTDIPTEAKLLAALTKRDKVFTKEGWSNVRIPGERVFLFPGAISPDDDSSELTYREVAHCDGCAKEIKVKVHKCIQCFDYDLCRMCYPKLSKDHFDGKHKFAAEQIERRK